jgi:Fe-S-cluster-containing hydrogenase component 2
MINNPKLLGNMVEDMEENGSRCLVDVNNASLQHTSSWQISFEGDENIKEQDNVVKVSIGSSTSELAKRPCHTSRTSPSAKVCPAKAISK